MDQRTRKLMILHKALYPKGDVDRLYVSRKEREEDLPALETVLTYQINDLKTTNKSVEKDWLQPPETILTTLGPTERL